MPTRFPKTPPPLLVADVLAWADAYRGRTGDWPNAYSGPVPEAPLGENWRKIDNALRYGLRGLPDKSSLAKLLAEHRGHRNRMDLPRLTIRLILTWADTFRKQNGAWPLIESGPIAGSSVGDTWKDIDMALRIGAHGLRGGRSLPPLLASRRKVRNQPGTPPLSVEQILAWADEVFNVTSSWPKLNSGHVPAHPGETWFAIDTALRLGTRGLAGGSSLAQLLQGQRGVKNKSRLPRLTMKEIVAWAEEHFRRTGHYPTQNSGTVGAAPDETWKAVHVALIQGLRGLRKGSTLGRLLAGRRNGHSS